MSRQPKAPVTVRVPQPLKAQLEAAATRENLTLHEYIARHFQELMFQQKIAIDTEVLSIR